MRVADAVGRGLAGLGARTVFGVVGSGNFHVTNALIAGGARFIAARHEGGATVMADAWARTTGMAGMVTVHQGPGLTNAMTGIAEAAKSRTPLLVLAAEAPEARSNFHVDVAGLAAAVGAVAMRLHSPASALADAHRAYTAALGRRTVILALPLDVQAATCEPGPMPSVRRAYPPWPSGEAVSALADVLRGARRPVFIAGRGARGTAAPLKRLADSCGALLATSAVAKGLFGGSPWNLDVSGGFASPLAAELISEADVIVGWGCSLNMWTTRHGKLLGPQATLVRWRDVPFTDDSGGQRIDPRALSAALDDLLPAERTVAVDSGNFMGYPSMYLAVPDEVHHFGPDGDPLDTVRFPPADIAAIARGFGFEGVTVRQAADLARSASGWTARGGSRC
jgi:thiamine pyrophosphate-dependent acetolactate synthase large subunit-like protein